MGQTVDMQFSQLIRNDDVSVRDFRLNKTNLIPNLALLNLVYYVLMENGQDMKKIEFRNIEFLRPFLIREGYHSLATINLIKMETYVVMSLLVQYIDDNQVENGEPKELMSCEIYPSSDANLKAIDIKTLRYNAVDLVDMDEVYSRARQVGMVHYDHLRGLGTLYEGKTYAIAQIHLDEGYSEKPAYYLAHPAYLEAAILTLYKYIDESTLTDPFIVTKIESFKMVNYINRVCNVHLELENILKDSDELICGEIGLYEGAGKLVAEIKGVSIVRVDIGEYLSDKDHYDEVDSNNESPKIDIEENEEEEELSSYDLNENVSDDQTLYSREEISQDIDEYENDYQYNVEEDPTVYQELPAKIMHMAWEESGIEFDQRAGIPTGIIVFGKEEEIYSKISRKINGNRDLRIVLVKPGNSFELMEENVYCISPTNIEDYKRLFEELKMTGVAFENIVYLWSGEGLLEVSTIQDCMKYGLTSINNIYETMIKEKREGRINLVFAHWLSSNEMNPMYAGMEGYLKALSMDNPVLQYKVIGIEKNNMDEKHDDFVAEILVKELRAMDQPVRNIKYGINGRRYVRNMIEANDVNVPATWTKDDGVYVIRNGLSLLGLKFAKLVASRCKCKLILVGTPDKGNDVVPYIKEIEELGAEVIKINGDFTNRYFIIDLISRIKLKFGKMDGLINVSGVTEGLHDNEKNSEQVKEYISKRVQEMLQVDAALAENEMDFIIQFSVIAGSSIQNYEHYYLESFYHYFIHNTVVRRTHKDVMHFVWYNYDETKNTTNEELVENMNKKILDKTSGAVQFDCLIASGSKDVIIIDSNQEDIQWMKWENASEPLESLDLLPWEEVDSREENYDDFDPETLLTQVNFDTDVDLEGNENIGMTGINDKYIGDFLKDENFVSEGNGEMYHEIEDVDDYQTDLEDNEVLGIVENMQLKKETSEEYADEEDMENNYTKECTEDLHSEQCNGEKYADRGYEEEDIDDHYAIKDLAEESYSMKDDNKVDGVESEVISLQEYRNKIADRSIKLDEMREDVRSSDPIAIIGMNGLMPSSADLDSFWNQLQLRKEFIIEVPKERWNWEAYYGDAKSERHKTKAKMGGFVINADKFDAEFFGIEQKEADLMDPQQRILLETVWKAVEDAGYRANDLKHSDTGVFVGIMNSDYQELVIKNNVEPTEKWITGLGMGYFSHRISSMYKLRGPSETINATTSSSGAAICRAIDEVSSGRCGMAIVASANLLLNPYTSILLDKSGVVSQKNNMCPFHEEADGYVRSEGIGAILLKPLSKAKEDGDNIYAIIRGNAINHGIAGDDLLACDQDAIEEVIYQSWEKSGIDPLTLSYVEAEGIATPSRDVAEFKGMTNAFNRLFEKWGTLEESSRFIRLGTIKNKIGHLEAAAGMAGLFNVIMLLKNRRLPGNPGFIQYNPDIEVKKSPFILDETPVTWENLLDENGAPIPRRAGVSNFGLSGVNVHLVLEEYMDYNSEQISEQQRQLFVFSAKNKDSLKDYAKRFIEFVENKAKNEKVNLADMAYTLQVGREPMEERVAIIANSMEELRGRLDDYYLGKVDEEFVFAGNIRQNIKSLDSLFMGQEAHIFVELLMQNHSYKNLAQLWILGIDLNWKPLHADRNPKRVSIPTYQFHGDLYWFNRTPPPGSKTGAVKGPLFTDVIKKSMELNQKKKNDMFSDINETSSALADFRQ